MKGIHILMLTNLFVHSAELKISYYSLSFEHIFIILKSMKLSHYIVRTVILCENYSGALKDL